MRLIEFVPKIIFFKFFTENCVIPIMALVMVQILRLFFSSFFAKFVIELAARTP